MKNDDKAPAATQADDKHPVAGLADALAELFHERFPELMPCEVVVRLRKPGLVRRLRLPLPCVAYLIDQAKARKERAS